MVSCIFVFFLVVPAIFLVISYSILFYSILFLFYSVLFYSILFFYSISILFYSILFLFCSILFYSYSILFYSIHSVSFYICIIFSLLQYLFVLKSVIRCVGTIRFIQVLSLIFSYFMRQSYSCVYKLKELRSRPCSNTVFYTVKSLCLHLRPQYLSAKFISGSQSRNNA
jgi:hypothetical protein